MNSMKRQNDRILKEELPRSVGANMLLEIIFPCPIFLPFHTVHGLLKARILKCFAFPSPVDHILSDLSTMTQLSCVAPEGMA